MHNCKRFNENEKKIIAKNIIKISKIKTINKVFFNE